MKKFSVKTIVAIGIGAALFFVLGRFVAIPSPVPNVNICVQYGLLAFMSVVYGPVAGALMGLIGHALIDFSYGPKNSYWHTEADTMDKISAESIKTAADVALRTVWQLAETGFKDLPK